MSQRNKTAKIFCSLIIVFVLYCSSVYANEPVDYYPASPADTKILLNLADKLQQAYILIAKSDLNISSCETERSCNFMMGDNAGLRVTTGSRLVLIGPNAGDYLTSESDRVVIAGMFDCDVKKRRCIYIGDWRLNQDGT